MMKSTSRDVPKPIDKTHKQSFFCKATVCRTDFCSSNRNLPKFNLLSLVDSKSVDFTSLTSFQKESSPAFLFPISEHAQLNIYTVKYSGHAPPDVVNFTTSGCQCSQSLSFSDHVIKRNKGSGNENGVSRTHAQ